MAKGCDYSWERPNLAALHRAGIEFVCRYLSHDTTGKNLSLNEAFAIKASGMDIVSNWEFAETAALNGRAQGVADAANAINQHVAFGGPSQAAIYFSVDFDAQDTDMRQIAAYFDGATATIGYDRVGCYGGFRTVSYMAATNRCKYFWQTSAWSGGRWHPAAQLRQVDYHVYIGGDYVDIDQSTTGDFGAWGGAGAPAPPQTNSGGDWDLAGPLRQLGDQFNGIAGELDKAAFILNGF